MQNIQHIFDIEVKYWTFNTYMLSTLKLNLTLNTHVLIAIVNVSQINSHHQNSKKYWWFHGQDGKLSNQKLEEANNLSLSLCKRYEVAFLDNSEIDQSHLNRSNLHLNRNGDKLLGEKFCSYLKLVKISRNAVHNQKLHGKNKPFFRLVLGHRMKEWSDHLKLVTNIMKK